MKIQISGSKNFVWILRQMVFVSYLPFASKLAKGAIILTLCQEFIWIQISSVFFFFFFEIVFLFTILSIIFAKILFFFQRLLNELCLIAFDNVSACHIAFYNECTFNIVSEIYLKSFFFKFWEFFLFTIKCDRLT